MTLILELPAELEQRLASEAALRSMSLQEYALERLGGPNGAHADGESEPEGGEHPILEVVRRIHASLPEDAFDALPHDGSINYRHYLYGHPKVTD